MNYKLPNAYHSCEANSSSVLPLKRIFRRHLELKFRQMVITTVTRFFRARPTASEVLTSYLKQCNEPPWTSYFVKYSSVQNDQFGMSHFNWQVGKSNYHILRTGCFPYMKYHCSKRPYADLRIEDFFFNAVKLLNLGIPCFMYGMAAIMLISHVETVNTDKGPVQIYFLMPEDKGSRH